MKRAKLKFLFFVLGLLVSRDLFSQDYARLEYQCRSYGRKIDELNTLINSETTMSSFQKKEYSSVRNSVSTARSVVIGSRKRSNMLTDPIGYEVVKAALAGMKATEKSMKMASEVLTDDVEIFRALMSAQASDLMLNSVFQEEMKKIQNAVSITRERHGLVIDSALISHLLSSVTFEKAGYAVVCGKFDHD